MTTLPTATAPDTASLVRRVLNEVRRGASTGAIAAHLGVPPELAAAVVAELVTTGVIGQACTPSGSCSVAGDTAPPTCAGCPLAR